jgi:hypothetical protein
MSKAPKRIWVDDERSIGGGVDVADQPPAYVDEYVIEYVRADLLNEAIDLARLSLEAGSLHRTQVAAAAFLEKVRR